MTEEAVERRRARGTANVVELSELHEVTHTAFHFSAVHGFVLYHTLMDLRISFSFNSSLEKVVNPTRKVPP